MLKNLGKIRERAVATYPDAPACSFLPGGVQRADAAESIRTIADIDAVPAREREG